MIEQASLVLGNGNWAVKSDSLLGYKTIDGKYYPREMTFTRATTGTRVNADGLVELVPYNLVSYSEQFDNAAWTKVNSTITANSIAAPNGTLTADTFTDNSTIGSHVIARFTTLIIGTQTASIYVKPDTLTKFYIANSSTGNAVCFDLTTQTIEGYTNGTGNAWTNASVENVGDGWFRVSASLVATATGTFSFGFYKVFNATSFGAMSIYIGTGETAYLWGAQLVEGTEAKTYLPTTDRLDIPRIDYSTGDAALLLEPQRTNLLQQSSSFDNAAWNKINTTITANDTIAPDNTQTADLVNLTGASGRVITSVTFTAAPYTFSTFVKYASQTDTLLRVFDGTTTFTLTLSWSGGVPSFVSNTGSAYNIQNYGDGWYRVSLTCTTAAAAGTVQIYPNGFNSSGTAYLWGAQLEAGSYATSYIPTTTASVTRNLDIVSKTGISSLIGQTEGTLFAEMKINNSSEFRVISISDGSINNRVVFAANGTTDLRAFAVYGGVVGTAITTSIPSGTIKIAVKYTASNYSFFVNGVLIGTQSKGAFANTLSVIANNQGNGGNSFFGYLSTALIYKTDLTDDQLAQITTI